MQRSHVCFMCWYLADLCMALQLLSHWSVDALFWLCHVMLCVICMHPHDDRDCLLVSNAGVLYLVTPSKTDFFVCFAVCLHL